jgi:hypothetical protein
VRYAEMVKNGKEKPNEIPLVNHKNQLPNEKFERHVNSSKAK